MFPTFFSITLGRSGVSQSSTSGLLCLAIVGGALLPYVVGQLADQASLSLAFLVPMLAYGAICAFGILAQNGRMATHLYGRCAPDRVQALAANTEAGWRRSSHWQWLLPRIQSTPKAQQR